ncbi:MAG: hypothetical protein KatS3mg050_0379 [Litorilinea sp.]|nr:MAG: hypothetical protein KatS3mg050_0379 [Litorilinea sp.]
MTTTLDPALQTESSQAQLAAIERKLDALTHAVAELAEQAREERRRRQVWEDLQADLTPIVRDVYGLAVAQAAELEPYVQPEEILALLKRLLRHTRSFHALLDELESAQDFVRDFTPVAREMMDQATTSLDALEQKGYFSFLQEGLYVLEQIVTSFTPADVRLLGDNIVLILNTVKALTQPEMMRLLHDLTASLQEAEAQAEELPTSLVGLLGQMRDPDVRRGLALTLAMLKRISRQQRLVQTEGGKSV